MSSRNQPALEPTFAEVIALIETARRRAMKTVNTELIDLYSRIGEYISRRVESDGWAKGTIVALAAYVQQRQPGIRGFSSQNLWRMRQFFETYCDQSVVSPLLRELPWSSHLHILGKAKLPEEREFYLRMAIEQRWTVREVARQVDAGMFERSL